MIDSIDTKIELSVQKVLQDGSDRLQQAGIESAVLVGELLLCHVLNCERSHLHAIENKPVPQPLITHYRSFIERACGHEPVQYIVGETEFMGLPFYVNPHVLIPRPDTEILVEKAIELAKSIKRQINVLDIGTGSGNIAVSMAKFLPGIHVEAIDVDDEALNVARKNISRNGVQQNVSAFIHDISKGTQGLHPVYELLVSNPPYISDSEFETLPVNVKNHEPHLALRDHADGLTFYKIIAEIAAKLVTKGGSVVVEIGYEQSAGVQDIFKRHGYSGIEVVKDYGGHERVIVAKNG